MIYFVTSGGSESETHNGGIPHLSNSIRLYGWVVTHLAQYPETID